MRLPQQFRRIWPWGWILLVLAGCDKSGQFFTVGPTEHQETRLGEYVAPTGAMVDTTITDTQWARLARELYNVPSSSVATIPNVLAVSATQGENGCHLAEIVPHGRQFRVLWDGVPGPDFDMVNYNSLRFSPDGKHLTYLAEKDAQFMAVLDQKPGRPYDKMSVNSATFSADSKHLWYWSMKNGLRILVLDGGEYPNGEMFNPIWSADGRHVVYYRGSTGTTSVVVDGKAGPTHQTISGSGPVMSPNGQHVLYMAYDGMSYIPMLDGVAGPSVKGAKFLTFSDDSKHYGYVALSPDRSFTGNAPGAGAFVDTVVIDGKPQKTYAVTSPLWFSPDGSHSAYFAAESKASISATSGLRSSGINWFLVVDGVEGLKLTEPVAVDRLAFGFGGKTAYIASNAAGNHVQVGNDAGPDYLLIDPLSVVFSRDGQHLAYYARTTNKATQVILDGKPGPALDFIRSDATTTLPVFSPNSKHLAYTATIAGKRVVVLDGQPGPELDWVPAPMFDPDRRVVTTMRDWPLVFSTDSVHLAYRAGKGGKQFVVIDQKPGPEYDEIVAGPVRRKDGSLEYLAAKKDGSGQVLVRVVVPNFSPAER